MSKSAEDPIVITGMGCVSALGVGWQPFWQGVVNGHSAISQVVKQQAGQEASAAAAVIESFSPFDYLPPDRVPTIDTFTQYALIAANEAISQAELDNQMIEKHRVGVILGTAGGGEASREAEAVRFFHQGKRRAHPALIAKTNHQAAVAAIAMTYGYTGLSFIVHSGCASGTHAIVQAVAAIRLGWADYVVTGGCEASVLFSTFKAFEAMGVLSQDTCRPFSLNRPGMALGEGAGILCIERLSSAKQRGVPVLAELCGVGMSTDAYDNVHPAAHGPAMAMRNALSDANLSPMDIGYINAHGTGTIANDKIETEAIKTVFSDHANRLYVSSTKSVHGHAIGAAGGFEAIATVLALREKRIPPTANFTEPDPECDLNYVPNHYKDNIALSAALSNSFALGGLNAVLAIRNTQALN